MQPKKSSSEVNESLKKLAAELAPQTGLELVPVSATAIMIEGGRLDLASLFDEGFRSDGALLKVPVGVGFRAIYAGPGREIALKPNERTGEVVLKKTWRFYAPGTRGEQMLCVIGDHNLDSHMSSPHAVVGCTVVAHRLPLVSLPGGRTVNNWVVFFQAPIDMIDAK